MKKSKTDGCIIHSPQRLLEQYDLSYGQDSHGFEPVVYGGSPAKLPLGTDREQFVFFFGQENEESLGFTRVHRYKQGREHFR